MFMTLLRSSSCRVPLSKTATSSPSASFALRALTRTSRSPGSAPGPSTTLLTHPKAAAVHALAGVSRRRCSSWIFDRLVAASSAAHDSVSSAAPTAQQQQQQRSSSSLAQTQPDKLARRKAMPPVRDTVVLNDLEKELFATLLAAAQRAPTPTTLRCAGGWVRDKLLGRDSLDIDIALDTMLGKDFAELVNQHLASQGKEVRNAAIIQSNPEQSKHLETARLKISGLWIDLVNLRSETYAQGSRIPKMEFGTPEQDAMRRDFTINSLFYNINQGCVEDFTGRGVADLREGIIRTPLPPTETFLDDPLRVLRAVRFAARFACDLEPSVEAAAANEKVQAALAQKVSKERVGAELDGMFNGPAPVESMQLLQRLSLFPVVFALPQELQSKLPADYTLACVQCMATTHALAQLAHSQGLKEAEKDEKEEKEDARFLLLAALLLPLRACTVSGPKGKPVRATDVVIRESIKWRNSDVSMTAQLHDMAPRFLEADRQLAVLPGSDNASLAQHAPDSLKVELGTTIRELKQRWQLGALLAPILSTPQAKCVGTEDTANSGTVGQQTDGTHDAEQQVAQCSEVYKTLLAAVHAFGLQDCWQWKPLLDGKQVQALLGLQKPGPVLGLAMKEAMNWQLVHPQGSLEQCQEHIKLWQQQQQNQHKQ